MRRVLTLALLVATVGVGAGAGVTSAQVLLIATGGGQIQGTVDRVDFGFEVQQRENGDFQGRCVVIDSALDVQIKCLDVLIYGQVGNTATWEGTTENGLPYRITVTDNGEPNQGIDSFFIQGFSSQGLPYEAAGNVVQGNIQLHEFSL